MRKRIIAWLRLMRLFPTLVWVGVTTFVGVSVAAKHSSWSSLNYSSVLLVLSGGIVCHGLLSHSANDYVDWSTGTDSYSPGLFSGGSRVIPQGYLELNSMLNGMGLGVLVGAGLMVLLYLRVGNVAFWAGSIAALAAIFYSLPPLMLAYRPLMGEWLAVVPALSACAWLACLSASGGERLLLEDWYLIVAAALTLVGHLMFHHLSDIEADLAAVPPKLTTPAFAAKRGSDPRLVPAIYWSLVVLLCIYAKMYWLGFGCGIAALVSLKTNLTDRRILAVIDQVLFVYVSFFIVAQALARNLHG